MKNRCKKCFFENNRFCSKSFIDGKMVTPFPIKCTRALRNENKCGKTQKYFRPRTDSDRIVKEFENSTGATV